MRERFFQDYPDAQFLDDDLKENLFLGKDWRREIPSHQSGGTYFWMQLTQRGKEIRESPARRQPCTMRTWWILSLWGN